MSCYLMSPSLKLAMALSLIPWSACVCLRLKPRRRQVCGGLPAQVAARCRGRLAQAGACAGPPSAYVCLETGMSTACGLVLIRSLAGIGSWYQRPHMLACNRMTGPDGFLAQATTAVLEQEVKPVHADVH